MSNPYEFLPKSVPNFEPQPKELVLLVDAGKLDAYRAAADAADVAITVFDNPEQAGLVVKSHAYEDRDLQKEFKDGYLDNTVESRVRMARERIARGGAVVHITQLEPGKDFSEFWYTVRKLDKSKS